MAARGPVDDDDGEYHWSYTDEPHASRRRAIKRDHPEVKQLEGYDWRAKYLALAVWAVQLYVSTVVAHYSWWTMLALAFIVGGTCTQSLTLAIHELSHNLMFASPRLNRYFSIMLNFPLLFAYAVSFRKYHLEHHKWQGETHVDMDVPSPLEAKVVGTNPFKKSLWVFFQVLFYALRPVVLRPYAPTRWEIMNWAACLAFDAAWYYVFGAQALVYLFASIVLGLGPHPMAGHFIAEHYVFIDGVETYSYYGPLNFLAFDVGYHNEHHDFPRVPGFRLRHVRALAPEYYEDVPQYVSWARVLFDYVRMPNMSPWSRVKRRSAKAPRNQ
mmetsp:Transcript_45712/g.112040  ORF Transcript_45712/g.112040 Transcript_45712/m.112040 type:complete len:327 (+) Transcript_45712:3-983(+)